MFDKEARRVLIVTGLSHFAVHSSMLFFPSILETLMGEFSTGLDKLGWIYAISSFMFGLGAIPTGLIENKVGGRNLLILYQLGASVACFMVAMASSVTSLTISLAGLGLFSSIYHPASLTLISRRIKQMSRAMGYHGIAGSAGLASGPVLASWFSVAYTWRLAYVIMAIYFLVLCLLTAFLIPSVKRSSDESKVVYTRITRLKPLAIYYLITILVGLTFYGFSTYLPLHFSKNTGVLLPYLDRVVKGGLFTTLVLFAGMAGQYLGGNLGDKFKRVHLLPWIFLFQIPLLIFLGLTTGLGLLLTGLVLGIVYFTFVPIGNSMIAEFTTSASRGLGYGISFFLNFGLGSLASGFGGYLAVKYQVSFVFPFLAVFMILALLGSLILKKIS